ncbi:sugar-binding domain-containing protein [Haloferula sp. A504]|uniref:sugar-binding domain-containing protein n=1 Tax=Haloferula sp. A504 TaxID=3373601 RepID=UPI0031BFF8F6|nr:hypothetical protein [Verrucomicrobiaceae bacterium E54]
MKRLLLLALLVASAHAADTLPLAGEWRFQLDPDNTGIGEKWQTQALDDTIPLPGTTDEAKKGIERDEHPIDRLARPWYWKGAAWYQRDFTLPDDWSGKRVTLFLERTKNCQVWINDTYAGWDDTLSAPHIHDLTPGIRRGRNTITLLVDNSKLPPVGPSHQVDERTQTNWNGVVGSIELRADDPVWIEDVQVYPDAAKREAKVRVIIRNATSQPAAGELKLKCRSDNVEVADEFAPMTLEVEIKEKEKVLEFTYQPGGDVPLWDEFNPVMLKLDLELSTIAGSAETRDAQSVRFGMRDFTADYNQLKNNGTAIFLRGRLDCANYPLTGYAPMDKAEWLRIYTILRQWGLNHVRFHSWCPPKAAFEAADELGLYLQPELPNKRSGFNAPEDQNAAYRNIDRLDVETTDTETNLYDYGKREGELILREFGNHPSFVMFTLGNELGRNQGMFDLVEHFKQTDPRHLYAQGANNMHWKPSLAEGDDFWVTGKVGDDIRPIRGSFYIHDYRHGSIDTFPPGTLDDFSASIRGVPVPLIGHETGQYQVYPDFRDIDKFTGVLKGRNYEIFRDRLEEAGMLDQAQDFVRASGALAALCYREDIEMALRTPGFGGIQLLDIMDFPGQSTALVGMLNVFMESKGVIEAEKWREFCSETVPLLRIKKHAWTSDEVLVGRIEVAHYGPEDLADARILWTLTDSAGKTVSSHRFDPVVLLRGELNEVDFFLWPLAQIKGPERLDLTLSIEGTPYRNSYPIWVYPPEVDTEPSDGVIVSRRFTDPKTKDHLAKGGKVLLLPELDSLPESVGGGFQTEFWSPMFAKSARKRGLEEPPGTLGHLCDPDHPALAAFPTEFHSNWQWWHLVKHSRPIVLDDTPDDYRPIVQVIDNFDRNNKLGLLFETKVGKGAMLVCPIDLPAIQDQPEGRQFLHGLLRYLESDDFAPETELDGELLGTLFPG